MSFTSRSTRRSEEHTSELQSQSNLVCRLLLEKKKTRRRAGLSGYCRSRATLLGSAEAQSCCLHTGRSVTLFKAANGCCSRYCVRGLDHHALSYAALEV